MRRDVSERRPVVSGRRVDNDASNQENRQGSSILRWEVAMFSKILQRFMERSPVPVMVQMVLERVLSPAKLNALFERTAVEQYTRELLFSTVFELMNLVVFKTFPSINAAYQENHEQIEVSITSVYNKLNGVETGTSAALVRETAREKAALIETLGAVRESWLPGYPGLSHKKVLKIQYN
jgi:hypothetical protein